MVVEAKEAAERLLKDLVPDELLASYTRLLAQGWCSESDGADLLGGAERVEALIAAGMAHVQSSGPALPPRLAPVPPDLALQGTLAALTRRLVADQERLLAGQRRMAETNPWASPIVDESSDRLVRIITDREEIGNVSRSLITAARHDWMTMDNQSVERPMDELTAVPPPPSFEGHVRCRALYETSCAEHPVGVRTIEIAVEAGEEARLLPRIGMKMKLADEAIAMLPLTPTGMSGALLIRSSVIAAALREYFELLWERAIPFGAANPESPLKPRERQVLSMLAEGLTEASIAKRTGVSVTTVRRDAATIREKLGFYHHHFAAGAAAVRRGWIP
ncbi:helix-turn-helix transcriptional regulator [Actinomadura bangladeshensis]|uniref:LuxR family transcriptional regulator n=1 Tax=Actinomadura bangladeshensis TaxID=453573 RepID=A0A4R4P5A5_9ACTN|nr:helix-turn-helix transcriptional regulator [Actinomadura bangladeshensis]TDC17245.1 LuxR family transcriptional regulator [Actinomadura bangladeshensis]